MTNQSFNMFSKLDLAEIGQIAKEYYRDNQMKDYTSEQYMSRCYVEAVMSIAVKKNLITFTKKAQDEHEARIRNS